MYFGSITHKDSGITGRYTYMRRGTHIPLFPDLHKEDISEGHVKWEEGKLFREGTIGWSWTTVLDIGVDIKVNLDRPCYVDRIVINQGDGSAVQSVKVLDMGQDGKLSCRGGLNAATDSVLQDKQLEVIVGAEVQEITIRLEAYYKDIIVEGIDILGAVFDSFSVYPVPASMDMDKSTLGDISNFKQIVVSATPSDDTIFAANLLREKLYENHKIDLPIVKGGDLSLGSILIGKPFELVEFKVQTEAEPRAEGYILDTKGDTIDIIGADRRGLIYGLERFLQLIVEGQIPSCTIEDYPFMEVRGAHFGLPPREEIPFFKRLIRYVLAPMGYNTIFLEFAGGMRFDRHPKISEIWEEGNKKAEKGLWPPVPHGHMVAGGSLLEKDEVRDLVDYMRSYGFEVIPEVQSLGHVQYITMAYPEIAETKEQTSEDADIDLNKADRPPSEFYYGSYCPSNEKSYSIIFDIIDEIVEVVRPTRYVHMGHDEVYVIGTCPVCREKDPADLIAHHINMMHGHLAKKGLKMMMWADMLQDVTKYETPAAIDMIPKDIVLLDFIWYFHTDKDIEDHLLDHGFKVIMGNMYSSHYPRFEKRIRKKGILGAEVSTWKRVDEYNLGFEGKIYDFLYSANMVWSSSYRSDLRYSYDHMLSKIIPHIRSRLSGQDYPSLQKTKNECPIEMPSSKKSPWVPCELLEALPAFVDTDSVQAVAFKESVKIPIQSSYDSLLFLHTAGNNVERIPWTDPVEIGAYVVKYADGSEIEIPIEYGGNIGVWNRRHNKPIEQAYYRHQGYVSTYFADAYIKSNTRAGKDVTVYGYEWINPHKDKAIDSIELVAKGDTDSPVILCGIKGINA